MSILCIIHEEYEHLPLNPVEFKHERDSFMSFVHVQDGLRWPVEQNDLAAFPATIQRLRLEGSRDTR